MEQEKEICGASLVVIIIPQCKESVITKLKIIVQSGDQFHGDFKL